MENLDSPKIPAACDGVESGVPRQRVSALITDADNFNKALKANESDGTGKGNFQAAMDASRAFYDELTRLPISERKLLLDMAQSYNKAEAKDDPAMPTIESTMRQDLFLEKLTINYPEPFYPDAASKHEHALGHKAAHLTPERFEYQGSPMCAKFTPTDQTPPPQPNKALFMPLAVKE